MDDVRRAWSQLAIAIGVVLGSGMLAACGDDGDGDGDTLLTGFSGLVILIIVVWLIVRAVRKSR